MSISFYGDSLQAVVPRYLEQTMQAFARNQEQMRDYLRSAFDGLMPFASFEEMSKQQIAIFERAMRMLTPFYGEEPSTPERQPEPQSQCATEAQIEELRSAPQSNSEAARRSCVQARQITAEEARALRSRHAPAHRA